MTRELRITRLGAQGDGIAQTPDGPVYVPFTLPGERVAARVDAQRGELTEVLDAAPDRIPPVCVHYGSCGGCALQHLASTSYLEWKRQRVVDALAQASVAAEVEPVRAFDPRSRRRATFAALRTGRHVRFGFRRAHSHEVIALSECPVLAPPLEAAIQSLRELCAGLLPQGETRVAVTLCDNGLDVAFLPEGKARAMLSPALAVEAGKAGILRMTWRGDVLFSSAVPRVTLSGVALDLPPGAFLQAVGAAEAAMAALVVDGIGRARKVADLFAGLGTFSFALARKAAVVAVESDRAALAALAKAARGASGLKPIATLARDLMREPLAPMELNAFDAVVFDPPRAGAMAQAQALARSKVSRIVAVSCNPATFARDARALIDGGCRLANIVPVDQFAFSPHVELVAHFLRG
jgi:23S rRNA (uracil1939-C5)-methyltransferase